MNTITSRLNHLLQQSGLSPYQFSMKSGISQSTLSRILNKNSKPNASTLNKIAVFFNVEEEWILTGNSEKNLTELKTEDYLKEGQHKISLDEFALIAAQNIEKLKKKPVFYNTFVMEALNLLREAQNESGVIDPMKLTSKE